MNKIEYELYLAIADSKNEFDTLTTKDENAALNVFKLLEKHCIAFADFIESNEQYLHYWKSKYTTEQLFEVYLKTLENETDNI